MNTEVQILNNSRLGDMKYLFIPIMQITQVLILSQRGVTRKGTQTLKIIHLELICPVFSDTCQPRGGVHSMALSFRPKI